MRNLPSQGPNLQDTFGIDRLCKEMQKFSLSRTDCNFVIDPTVDHVLSDLIEDIILFDEEGAVIPIILGPNLGDFPVIDDGSSHSSELRSILVEYLPIF
jgi:hypothetical protein